MRTTTKLDRISWIDNNNPDYITIFFTKQCHGSDLHRFILWHLFDHNRDILSYLTIYQSVNLCDFVITDFCKMGKVKPEMFVIDQASFLRHMCSQYFS